MHIDDLALIALMTIAATLFVHRGLTDQPWFLAFLAAAAPVQVALVILFPLAHLARNQVILLAFADALCLIALVFLVEWRLVRRTHMRGGVHATRPAENLTEAHFAGFAVYSTDNRKR